MPDPLTLAAVGVLTVLIVGYAAYLKISIRRLDRKIAAHEAAEAVGMTPPSTAS